MRYLAFLRAINVGGRRVAMGDLAAAVSGVSGVRNVSTYIASGNVVFDSTRKPAGLEADIERAVVDLSGFVSEVFVRSHDELRRILAYQPFGPTHHGETHMIAFLKTVPSPSEIAAFEARSNEIDTLVVQGREVHWRLRGSYMASQLKPRDWRLLNQPNTNRNRTMVAKLVTRL